MRKKDADGTRGDEDTSRGVSTTPREGTKQMGKIRQSILSTNNNRSANTRSKTLHSVCPITPEGTKICQRTQVNEHYFPFILVTSQYLKTHSYLFLTNVARKGWSDPPSHRLPVHNELQTGLDSLRRLPADPAQRRRDVGRKILSSPPHPRVAVGKHTKLALLLLHLASSTI